MLTYNKCEEWFGRFAKRTSDAAGKPVTFVLSLLLVAAWALTGPMFNYSDTWQLVINTATTVITFLMVFVIQNSQNADGLAIQAKLDELISATEGARDELERIENKSPQVIEELRR